jgi:hypothetical protein
MKWITLFKQVLIYFRPQIRIDRPSLSFVWALLANEQIFGPFPSLTTTKITAVTAFCVNYDAFLFRLEYKTKDFVDTETKPYINRNMDVLLALATKLRQAARYPHDKLIKGTTDENQRTLHYLPTRAAAGGVTLCHDRSDNSPCTGYRD